MKAWFKSHKILTGAIAVAVLWILYRVTRGLSLTSPGHSSPEDAISFEWSVYQAGITGWLEVSPDSKTSIMHNTGWAGDPYKSA
jgi:hypothetical protein